MTTTVPVIPSCWSHMNEYVPARVNVHTPAHVPAVGKPGNCTELDDVPPAVCWHDTPLWVWKKSTLCISLDEFAKVTVPPVTMFALVAEPLPATSWN